MFAVEVSESGYHMGAMCPFCHTHVQGVVSFDAVVEDCLLITEGEN
jgi:hypothetical protein